MTPEEAIVELERQSERRFKRIAQVIQQLRAEQRDKSLSAEAISKSRLENGKRVCDSVWKTHEEQFKALSDKLEVARQLIYRLRGTGRLSAESEIEVQEVLRQLEKNP